MKMIKSLRLIILGMGSDAQIAPDIMISSGLASNNSELTGFLLGSLSLTGKINWVSLLSV